MSTPRTALDLFSGAGGMSRGLLDAGFDVKAAVDSWLPAVTTYRQNFEHPVHLRDVAALRVADLVEMTGVAVGELDLIAGGPPCQGFSVQRIGNDLDVRNELVNEYGRIIAEFQPRLFLMENVPGLLGRRGASAMRNFLNRVSGAGYETLVTRINATEFGVAQSRPRVLVYGWRCDIAAVRPPSSWGGVRTVRDAFLGLPAASPAGSKCSTDPMHVSSRMSVLNKRRLRHIPPGGGFEDLPLELRADCHRNGASNIGHRAVYGRLHPDRPAGVITARFDSFTRGRFAHPWEHRNITLREGARLQAFDDSFVFCGNREEIAALIGNAVPPPVAAAAGRSLMASLQTSATYDPMSERKSACA